MKKIAYICCDPGVPVFGVKGCSIHVQEGIRALRNQGAQVTLFAQRIGGTAPADLADIACYKLPRLSKESASKREQSALSANKHLITLLNAHGPFDIVYERYSLWGYAGMQYAQQFDIPGILEVNAPLIDEQRTHRTLIHENEASQVASQAFGHASALIAVSAGVGDYLSCFSEANGKIHVIPNGVDPDRFSPENKPSCPGPPNTFTVGFVGSLKPWHGVLDLVEAFAILHRQAPESRLLIVGDGPERALVEARLTAFNLRMATVMPGTVSPDMVPGLIASMDVGVAPYPVLDNCYFSPLKAFEYMAAGLAFIGSKTGQLSQLVQHGHDGLLYDPGDIQMLATHLISLRDKPQLRTALGKAARRKVLRAHTWDSVGARIMAIAEKQDLFEAA